MAKISVVEMTLFLFIFMISQAFAQVNLENVNAGCQPGGCSGYGFCNNLSVCVCDEWWSSSSDFIIVQDCTLSIIAMYIMWGFLLAICLTVFYKTAWVIVVRFENFFVQRRTVKGYTLWKNPGLLSVIFVYMAILAVTTMCINKLVDPTTAIAFDKFTTALFFLGKTGLYLGAIFLQGPLLAIALKGEPMFDSLVKFNSRFNVVVNFMAIVIGGVPFITLIHFQTNIPKQFEVIRAYYFCQAIVLALQFVESYLVKLRLNRALSRAKNLVMSSEKTNSILKRVNTVQDSIIKQSSVQCVINVVLGAVPFLLNKHAYFLPISWIAIPLIGKNVALQVELDKKGAKTIRQRFKQIFGTGSSAHNTGDNASSLANLQQMASGKIAVSDQGLVTSNGYMDSKNPVMKAQGSQVGSNDGMEELLQGEDETHKRKFADFVRAQHASDSLNFYYAVMDYEKSGSAKEYRAKGDAIMKKFIADGASEPIDLPHDLRERLLSIQRQKRFDAKTFAEAKKISFDLLKANFYHKFVAEMTGA